MPVLAQAICHRRSTEVWGNSRQVGESGTGLQEFHIACGEIPDEVLSRQHHFFVASHQDDQWNLSSRYAAGPTRLCLQRPNTKMDKGTKIASRDASRFTDVTYGRTPAMASMRNG